jgi:hypothetical protein
MEHNKLSGTHYHYLETCPLPQHEPIIPLGEVPCTSTSFFTPQMGNPTSPTQSTSRLRLNHVDLGAPLPPLVPQCLIDLILLRKMEVYTHTHHGTSPLIGTNLLQARLPSSTLFQIQVIIKNLQFIGVL